jgi:hypothetical protein
MNNRIVSDFGLAPPLCKKPGLLFVEGGIKIRGEVKK